MNNKNIAYALIVLGALDLIIWVSNGFSYGYFEFIVGVNFLSKFGAWIMISIGIYLLNKEKGVENSEIDLLNDLEQGEEVIFKSIGNSSIINLTKKKIIYRALVNLNDFAANHNNVFTAEKAIIPYNTIESVSSVRTKDTAKNTLGGLINMVYGIQLKMKDGTICNLHMSSNSELISAHISKNLNV